MLVLMAGMEMSEGGKKIAGMAGLNTGENRFFSAADHHFGSNISNVKGSFLCRNLYCSDEYYRNYFTCPCSSF